MLLNSMTSFLSLPLYTRLILWSMIVWLFIVLINVLNGVNRYFRNKAEYTARKTEEMKHIIYTKMTIGTMDALILIEKLIDIAINNKMEIQLLGGTPFNILQMDHDIDEVSQQVYMSFRAEYFSKQSKDILVMDYWHNYIVDQTTVRMMRGYQRVNSELLARQPVKG